MIRRGLSAFLVPTLRVGTGLFARRASWPAAGLLVPTLRVGTELFALRASWLAEEADSGLSGLGRGRWSGLAVEQVCYPYPALWLSDAG